MALRPVPGGRERVFRLGGEIADIVPPADPARKKVPLGCRVARSAARRTGQRRAGGTA
jgi:hypothetical protein